jgi:FkbM family methyltransferase
MAVVNNSLLKIYSRWVVARWTPTFQQGIVSDIWNRSLACSTGVLHVGAHLGEEAATYEEQMIPGFHVEGDPKIFERLKSNLSQTKLQIPIFALVSDGTRDKSDFYRANNDGHSSSIFELSKVGRDYFPDLELKSMGQFPTTTIDALIEELEAIKKANLLVLDVQGAEHLVLKGATKSLHNFDLLRIEVSSPPVYSGAMDMHWIIEWLTKFGFISLFIPEPPFHGDLLFFRSSHEVG